MPIKVGYDRVGTPPGGKNKESTGCCETNVSVTGLRERPGKKSRGEISAATVSEV